MNLLDEKFIKEMGRCKNPTIFIGVARILGVELLSEDRDENNCRLPRPFESIAVDMVQCFEVAGRKRKRELLKIFAKANNESKGDDFNASGTENTEAPIQD